MRISPDRVQAIFKEAVLVIMILVQEICTKNGEISLTGLCIQRYIQEWFASGDMLTSPDWITCMKLTLSGVYPWKTG